MKSFWLKEMIKIVMIREYRHSAGNIFIYRRNDEEAKADFEGLVLS